MYETSLFEQIINHAIHSMFMHQKIASCRFANMIFFSGNSAGRSFKFSYLLQNKIRKFEI